MPCCECKLLFRGYDPSCVSCRLTVHLLCRDWRGLWQHAHFSSSPAEFLDRLVDERAFARPCRTRYAYCEGFSCTWIQLVNESATTESSRFNNRNGLTEGPVIALQYSRG